MKKKTLALVLAFTMTAALFTGCGSKKETETTQPQTETAAETESEEVDDQAAADEVAALIDAIYVQTRNENTDEQCAAAKAAWDKLTDAQKELVEGENADPDYFGRDTGDASKDDPLNEDGIGENELLVVSFGTSFNDSRAEDIGGVEKALQEANPDWSVRRAFTAQIIINHVQARDGEKIDNVEQALDRAVENGVKNLVVQPTHLMHGAEYDELSEAVEKYKDKFESVKIAEPLLGEVGSDATVVNEDKKAVAEILTEEAVEKAGYHVGDDVVFAMDAAASELYDEEAGVYIFPGESRAAGKEPEEGAGEGSAKDYCKDSVKRSADEMIALYEELIEEFPIVSIEDGLFEDDWEGWQKMTKRIGGRVQLVGDDLFVTNPKRIKCGIDLNVANAVLIKVNQIGTVTEAMEAIEMAKCAGYQAVISHRSGETEDAFIADLAVAVNAGQIKTGAPCRGERTAKYNQLLRIEEELKESARYGKAEIIRKK